MYDFKKGFKRLRAATKEIASSRKVSDDVAKQVLHV